MGCKTAKFQPKIRRADQMVQAFERAKKWQVLIECEGFSRADIARREGISRARVTQVMGRV